MIIEKYLTLVKRKSDRYPAARDPTIPPNSVLLVKPLAAETNINIITIERENRLI